MRTNHFIYVLILFIALLYEGCVRKLVNNQQKEESKPIYYSFYDNSFNDSIKSRILNVIAWEKRTNLLDTTEVNELFYYLILSDFHQGARTLTIELEYCNPKMPICKGIPELIKSSNRFYILNSNLTLPVIFDYDIKFSSGDNGKRNTTDGGCLFFIDYKKKTIEEFIQG